MGLLGAGATIFETFRSFFSTLGGEFLGLDGILLFAGIALVLLIGIVIIVINFTAEVKTSHAILAINNYLAQKPFVTDENIVEFNKLMKRVPKSMREQWQKYMLNRNDKPSKYLNSENCVKKLLTTSTYHNIATYYIKIIYILIALISCGLTLGALVSAASQTVAGILLRMICVPVIVILVGAFFNIIIRSSYNALVADLFFNFSVFENNIDRATSTFPDVVDYEVLFTRKEIINGIPALQEYLEQRAQFEEEQLKKAREKEVEHEQYDFSKLGVNGSLVMERAMKESEHYLGNRRRLLTEIDQISSEKDGIERKFDDNNKNSQRKLREISEALERLKEKLANTTNKIVSNDIRKQQADEVRKQQVIEKEMDEETSKYNADIARVDSEIAKRKEEIEAGKILVEKALINEFTEFSTKVINQLTEEAYSKVEKELSNSLKDSENLKYELEERDRALIESTTVNEEQSSKIITQSNELAQKNLMIINLNNELNEARRNLARASRGRKRHEQEEEIAIQEVFRYFDAEGKEFYYDEEGWPYFVDENGKSVYYDEDRNGGDNGEPQFVEDEYPLEEQPVQTDIEPEIEEDEEEAYYVTPEIIEEPIEAEQEIVEEEKEDSIVEPEHSQTLNALETILKAPLEPIIQEEKVEEELNEMPIKKGRGRPKKQETLDEEVKTTEKKSRGRPKKEDAPKKDEETSKKGRGRPKKEDNGEQIVEEKKSRGRPKKEETQEEVKTTEKKSRGRPKKEDNGEQIVEVKKGRGRPKKEETQEKEVNTAEKKSRGRPKKTNELSEIEREIALEKERLKKQKENLGETITIAEDDVNEKLKNLLENLNNDDDNE